VFCTLGQYDFVITFEVPDEKEAMHAFGFRVRAPITPASNAVAIGNLKNVEIITFQVGL